MAQQRELDIQSFIEGESNSMYQGTKNTFYQGENIEIRKNEAGLQLSALVEDTGWVFDDNITYARSLQELGVLNGGFLVCLENGKIFLDGVLKRTLSSGTSAHNEIIGVGVNTDSTGVQRVYYVTSTSFGAGKIHRSTTDLNTWNIDYLSYTTTSGSVDYACVLNYIGNLYIGVRDKIYTIDSFGLLEDVHTLDKNSEIKFISYYDDVFRIYSNIISNGVQTLWDGMSEFGAPQIFKGKPFLGGESDGAYDYMTVGFNENYASLVRFAGTQLEEIKVNLETDPNTRIFNRYVSIRDSIVYIGGGKTGQSDNYGVYTYGNYQAQAPKSLVQSYTLPAQCLHHSHIDIYSYFACNDNKVYRINHNNPAPKYALSGYVVTNFYEAGQWEELDIFNFKYAFETNGGTINIYARIKEADTFLLIKSITNAEYGNKSKVYFTNGELVNKFSEFDKIQFKIELIRGTTENTTPVSKRFTGLFNIIKQEA